MVRFVRGPADTMYTYMFNFCIKGIFIELKLIYFSFSSSPNIVRSNFVALLLVLIFMAPRIVYCVCLSWCWKLRGLIRETTGEVHHGLFIVDLSWESVFVETRWQLMALVEYN